MMAEMRARFENIFEQHFDDVYSYVAFRVAPDCQAAEDLTQDVFEAALRGWQSIRVRGAERAWLLQIARNKVADYFRVLARNRRDIALADASVEGCLLTDESETIGNQTMAVSLTLRQLPDDYVELLELKYIIGMSVRALAAHRATSEKAVESLLSRARQAFKEAFERVQNQQESTP